MTVWQMLRQKYKGQYWQRPEEFLTPEFEVRSKFRLSQNKDCLGQSSLGRIGLDLTKIFFDLASYWGHILINLLVF